MNIENRPLPHYFSYNNAVSTVLHVDLGTYEGSYNHLKNVAKLSYHYYIKKNGVAVKFVDIKHGPWHAGKVVFPTQEIKDFYKGINPNKMSLGICYEGRGVDKNGNKSWNWSNVVDGEKPNDKQIKTCIELIKLHNLQDKPVFAHREIRYTKPKVVLGFRDKVREGLKQDNEGDTRSTLDTISEKMYEIKNIVAEIEGIIKGA